MTLSLKTSCAVVPMFLWSCCGAAAKESPRVLMGDACRVEFTPHGCVGSVERAGTPKWLSAASSAGEIRLGELSWKLDKPSRTRLTDAEKTVVDELPATPALEVTLSYVLKSDDRQGWFRDIDALQNAIAVEDRGKVFLCLHGWFNHVGRYCFDPQTGQLDREWTVFSNDPNVKDFAYEFALVDGEKIRAGFTENRPVKLTIDDIHKRIAYARLRGFRVGLYYASGVESCDALPHYSPERALDWRHVWMMKLMRDVALTVQDDNRAHGRQLALLASDMIGAWGPPVEPPYCLAAHGTCQDSHRRPQGNGRMIFPNYRHVFWSCAWWPMKNWRPAEFGVRYDQTPVPVSNGFGDNTGFSEMIAEIALLFK